MHIRVSTSSSLDSAAKRPRDRRETGDGERNPDTFQGVTVKVISPIMALASCGRFRGVVSETWLLGEVDEVLLSWILGKTRMRDGSISLMKLLIFSL